MKKLFTWLLTLAWAVVIWRLTTTTQIVVTEEYWLQNILMMGAHFTFFGTQAVLLLFALPKRLYTLDFTPYTLHFTLITVSLYGALIELRQLFVPGRSSDPMDWVLDTLGAITFLAIINKLSIKS